MFHYQQSKQSTNLMTAITYTMTSKMIHYIQEDEAPFIEGMGQQSPFGSGNVTVSLLQRLRADGQVRKPSLDIELTQSKKGGWEEGTRN